MFKKILIANRGEIAIRIIRTCRDLSIQSVAVFSQADQQALHVILADEAYCIGPAPSQESYLCGEKIIAVAKKSGATAIHPGYGFLSENAEFAKLCEENGIVFIGPTATSMFAMGDKVRSRQLAISQKVPVIPGTPPLSDDSNVETLSATIDKEIGYPLLIKCSGGGGGHGMRVVQNASELIMALKLTRAEGKKAFGNDTVYMERALRKPRHIEVQLFGYGDGKVAHLFTRACSVQRRYQKIIEEAPAPMVTAAKLRQMEQDAIKLAASLNYRGAGTAEFLLDEDGQHYFLEMNTRLQVEHAVTEMILGIDLVALQIQLAAGVDLSAPLLRLQDQQKTIHPRGHAIECRIYAENPLQNFAPAPGNIVHLRLPQGPNVRVDSGIYAGFQVPVFYDAMIAKFITWGPDRDTARRRMLRAIDETVITGITTNLQFLKQALQCNSFIRGDYSTKIIDDEKLLSKLADSSKQSDPHVLTAAAASYLEIQSQSNTPRDGEQLSAWQTK